MQLHVIHDPPAEGAWNMAVDEMMLQHVAATGEPILRFYAWQAPTLSLGYFQSLAAREGHAASRDCPAVRRSTGGGAIVHDREITYSIAFPVAQRWSAAASALYDTVHGGLVAALAQFQVYATLCEATLHPLENEPFLCFERRAEGDVLLGRQKIAGSAQRRRQGAVLQHGSLLWERSPAAPELPGLADLCNGPPPNRAEFLETWIGELQRRASSLISDDSLEPLPAAWTADQRQAAEGLLSDRFRGEAWLRRRA
jgi:lipoyl(octanoyl) transferase